MKEWEKDYEEAFLESKGAEEVHLRFHKIAMEREKDRVIKILQKRIEQLERTKVKMSTIPNERRKHPAYKQWYGKLLEAKYILKLIR